MTYAHRPVMLEEVSSIIDAGPGATYVDATVGGGGHAERLAALAGPTGKVLGLDRDPAALEAASARLGRFGPGVVLVQARFSTLADTARAAGFFPANGVLFDLGASSPQLDLESRGFSYHGRAPLDMRMDPSAGGATAADLLNGLAERDLSRIFWQYGEERWAARIAAFVVEARRRAPVGTADDLVDIVKRAVPAAARRGGPHPARRVFQALRIAVNDELGELGRALAQAPEVLAPGGRVVVIAYHSLEDRVVKRAFRDAERGCRCPPGLPECRCGGVKTLEVLTRKPLTPSAAEVAVNPRARSAKLRAARKL